MKTYKLIITIFLIGIVNKTFAQKLEGVIVNSINQPVEAAYVYNLNSKSHAHSLENGVFNIGNSKVGDSIKVGLLGYKNKILVLKESNFKTKLNIVIQEKSFQLKELVISETLNPVRTITRLGLKINPVNSSQEILRQVPGLIIGQHAGGGKAEQIFLRGFDIDHGTDISLSVDGMPINMVSHAHGQGYSDLHFIIPETINKIDFGKGSYYAKHGDFATAGYVDFSTKDYLKESTISISSGQFNTFRTLGAFNLLDKIENQSAYLATEYIATDGPFESPQNFNRLNLFGKYTVLSSSNDKLSITASHFTSRWDASGQIPQREVNNGNISRFGAIDDTEGGFTSRSNFNVAFSKHISNNSILKTNAFYSQYAFKLYSNFTFFLDDTVNGDQIKQEENRRIFGFNTAITKTIDLGANEVSITSGLSLRHDIVDDIELSHTLNRQTTLEQIQFGDLNQTNISAFSNAEFDFGKFKITPALRLDYFKFLYNDRLQTNYQTLAETKTTLSPKLNFYYSALSNLQLYLKSGIGFHSNDTRVVVSQQGKDVLPKSYGLDFGNIWKPSPNFIVNSALWYLFLEQEFVYVGDAGIVEPSGKTERFGIDLGLRYQLNDWVFFNTDATLTNARSIEDPKGQNFIPLAPDFTMTGGISIDDYKGFSGGIQYRYIDDRPANEDNSIVAQGYFVSDLNANYSFNNITVGFTIENLFDTDWNETQFATESRLKNETQPVEEIHFTPGTPFFIKGTISYRF